MSSIKIFVEGGGDTARGQSALREGFDKLLSEQKRAAQKKLRWQLALYGSRSEAFKAFRDATTKGQVDLAVLLVDSEGPVTDKTPGGRVAHLMAQDRWDFAHVDPSHVHLMTHCMEAWVVADEEELEAYYGKNFKKNALPKRIVLDDEPKLALYAAIQKATKDTTKGAYRKIKHASALLKLVRPAKVAERCVSFKQFTQWLDDAIGGA